MTIELTKEQLEYLKKLIYADSYVRSEQGDTSKDAQISHSIYAALRKVQ